MILTEFLVVLYADHVRCHPYIERVYRLSNRKFICSTFIGEGKQNKTISMCLQIAKGMEYLAKQICSP